LPRFIRSVKVHSFDFGDVPPVIEVKDICDPHPDFYEEEDEDDDSTTNESDDAAQTVSHRPNEDQSRNSDQSYFPKQEAHHENRRPFAISAADSPLSPLFMSSTSTPGIPGGTSNLTYFHLPYAPGLSGSTTPFAAVAGGQFLNQAQNVQPSKPQTHHHSASISSLTPSSSDPMSRPPSQHMQDSATQQFVDQLLPESGIGESPHALIRDPHDLQVVSHVKYSGNMNLVLTAEILLDYPMPSFVGVPFKLHITGFSFDGVSILAYARKKLHFCFLPPEEAKAFLLPDSLSAAESPTNSHSHHAGGLLEEIRVESEIGQKENGKQVLKNVGKVEKFILEQVRKIFDDEFVFPSFWTFLV
jgi:distribution and morphology protein 12